MGKKVKTAFNVSRGFFWGKISLSKKIVSLSSSGCNRIRFRKKVKIEFGLPKGALRRFLKKRIPFLWLFPGLWENLSRPSRWNFAGGLTKIVLRFRGPVWGELYAFKKRNLFLSFSGFEQEIFVFFKKSLWQEY